MKLIKLDIQIDKALTALLFSAIMLLSACSESTTPAKDTHFDAYLQQAQSYLDTYQFKPAFDVANNAVKAAPERIEGYLALAKINQALGYSEQNVKLLENFAGAKNSEYYFLLLEAYQESGKIISAQSLIDQHNKVLQDQPLRFQFAQATQLLYKSEWPQAKTAFQALLESPDYKIDSMLSLAKIEASTNHLDNAVSIIDEILALDPQHTDTLLLKSLIYMKQGDLADTETTLTDALTSLPTTDIFTTQRIQIIQGLTNVLTQQGRSAEAMIYTRILAEEFPQAEAISLQYARALELFENQQFSAAKELLREILDNVPGHKKSATLLGLILYNEGDAKSAEKYLASVVDPEISPVKLTELYMTTQLQQNKPEEVLALLEYIPEKNRNAETWILYAGAAIQQKRFAEAKFGLDQAASLDPKSIRVTLLKNVYYNNLPTPQPDMALQTVAKGLTTNPENQALQALYIKQLLALNKTTEANSYVTDLENKYATDSNTQLLVANYYVYQQNLDKAKQILEKILVSEEDNIQALYSMAKVNRLTQNWSLALNNYKDIITFYPSEISAYQGAVLSLMQLQKDPLTASEYLPKNYEASLLALTLGELSLQQNKLDLAVSYAKQAENELPSKYQANLDELRLQLSLRQAIIAFSQKNYTQSRQIVMTALQQSPQDIRLLSLLTRIETTSGQYGEAKKVTQQIATILPNSSLATRLDAGIFSAQGEPQKAINLLASYWQDTKDEQVAEPLYLLWRSNNSNKASTFLNEWQEALPGSIAPKRYQAISLQAQGNTQQALQVYEKLLAQTPNDIISLNNAAWLYFQAGDAKAENLAEKAYRLMPNNAAILDTYGWILYKNGKLKQGKQLIEKALLLSPDEQEIKAHLQEVSSN